MGGRKGHCRQKKRAPEAAAEGQGLPLCYFLVALPQEAISEIFSFAIRSAAFVGSGMNLLAPVLLGFGTVRTRRTKRNPWENESRVKGLLDSGNLSPHPSLTLFPDVRRLSISRFWSPPPPPVQEVVFCWYQRMGYERMRAADKARFEVEASKRQASF